jgi:hypothetical protein
VPEHVLGDESKLRQVLLNLLGNAVKFTNAGEIWLRVDWLDEERATFEVGDTGYGIAEEEMADLFSLFTQTESGRRAQEGTGLGLAISRSYVRLMGGEIDLQSALGKGTVVRFTLSLPRASAVASAESGPGRVTGLAPGEPPYRVLVVDDIQENRPSSKRWSGTSAPASPTRPPRPPRRRRRNRTWRWGISSAFPTRFAPTFERRSRRATGRRPRPSSSGRERATSGSRASSTARSRGSTSKRSSAF